MLKADMGHLGSGDILPKLASTLSSPGIRYSDDIDAWRLGDRLADDMELTSRLQLDGSMPMDSGIGDPFDKFLSGNAVFEHNSRLAGDFLSLEIRNRAGIVSSQTAVKEPVFSRRSISSFSRLVSSALRRFKKLSVSGKRWSLPARASDRNKRGIWNLKRLSRVFSSAYD